MFTDPACLVSNFPIFYWTHFQNIQKECYEEDADEETASSGLFMEFLIF